MSFRSIPAQFIRCLGEAFRVTFDTQQKCFLSVNETGTLNMATCKSTYGGLDNSISLDG